MYTVYQLLDPRTFETRYVGITTCPLHRRLGRFISNKRQPLQAAWVMELAGHDMKPIIKALEITDDPMAEHRWIQKMKDDGAKLLNNNSGGSFYDVMTPEHKENNAAARRGRKTPDHVKEKIRASCTGQKRTPETCAKIAANNRRRTLSQATHEKMSRSAKLRKARERAEKLTMAQSHAAC